MQGRDSPSEPYSWANVLRRLGKRANPAPMQTDERGREDEAALSLPLEIRECVQRRKGGIK